WVVGTELSATSPSNIINGALYPYINSVGAYHCPGDKSRVTGPTRALRLRSYMLSLYLDGPSLGRDGMNPLIETAAYLGSSWPVALISGRQIRTVGTPCTAELEHFPISRHKRRRP